MSSANSGFIPAAPPPEGITPNFESGDSIAYRIFVVGIFFPLFALIFLSLRLFSAISILKKWHLDDTWIIVAFVISVANSIVCMVQTQYGLGRHNYEISLTDFQQFMKIGMISGPLTYNLATLFIKISILTFYLRFSVERTFRYTVYFVMFVTVGYTIPNAILFLYVCRPMQYYWDFSLGGECVNINAAFHTANTLNMVTDFAILLLPIWMLKPLRAPLLKKIGVTLILMAGGFVCAVSLVRMITALVGIAETDLTWHYVSNLIWWIVEMDVGIVCACLPCLKPFVKHYFPNLIVFDLEFEQRVEESFRISNRVARFTRSGTRPETTVPGTNRLRSKPSRSSNEVEEVTAGPSGTVRLEGTLMDSEKSAA